MKVQKLERKNSDLSKKLSIFENYLAERDEIQQFIEHVKNDIEFHEENDGKYLGGNHNWDIEKQMIKEYQEDLMT